MVALAIFAQESACFVPLQYAEGRNITNLRHPCLPDSFPANSNNSVFRKLNFDNTYDYDGIKYATLLAGQILLSFTTGVCIVLVAQYYKLLLAEKRREWSGIVELDLVETAGTQGPDAENLRTSFESSYKFWESGLKWQLLIEICLHAIHPIQPFMETLSTLSNTFYEVFQILMFLRLYVVLRHLYYSSDVYLFRYDIIAGKKELKRYGYRITIESTIKLVFYDHPVACAIGFYFIPIMIYAFFMFVIEGDQDEFRSLADCLWFSFVTMATIGYGDRAPRSLTARMTVVFMACSSFFTVATIGGVVTNLLVPSREQKSVATCLQRLRHNEKYCRAAVNMITVAYRERQKNRALRAAGITQQIGEQQLQRSVRMYSAVKRLRHARFLLSGSMMTSADPVMEQKILRSVLRCCHLYELLRNHLEQLLLLENKVYHSVEAVKMCISSRKEQSFEALMERQALLKKKREECAALEAAIATAQFSR